MEFCKKHEQHFGGPKGECLMCVIEERDKYRDAVDSLIVSRSEYRFKLHQVEAKLASGIRVLASKVVGTLSERLDEEGRWNVYVIGEKLSNATLILDED